ncbi:unnamed protein product [Caenorhabditis sp. 36 PRJEB53466]|nr:unnamed protein product [Caenorhabditis sp. 36 PRJEB53466]
MYSADQLLLAQAMLAGQLKLSEPSNQVQCARQSTDIRCGNTEQSADLQIGKPPTISVARVRRDDQTVNGQIVSLRTSHRGVLANDVRSGRTASGPQQNAITPCTYSLQQAAALEALEVSSGDRAHNFGPNNL